MTSNVMNGDGLLADALRTIRTAAVWVAERLAQGRAAAAETSPEGAATAPVASLRPAGDGPRTLAELGVERGFSREIEASLVLLGAVRADGRTGWVFKTPDGVSHALRVDAAAHPGLAAKGDLAA